ncbi:MAG: hypothetical protein MPJ24_10430 [Pirellulaceae bacterium]|nr:hypothetical protein [Pirellulaceae bacterium]
METLVRFYYEHQLEANPFLFAFLMPMLVALLVSVLYSGEDSEFGQKIGGGFAIVAALWTSFIAFDYVGISSEFSINPLEGATHIPNWLPFVSFLILFFGLKVPESLIGRLSAWGLRLGLALLIGWLLVDIPTGYQENPWGLWRLDTIVKQFEEPENNSDESGEEKSESQEASQVGKGLISSEKIVHYPEGSDRWPITLTSYESGQEKKAQEKEVTEKKEEQESQGEKQQAQDDKQEKKQDEKEETISALDLLGSLKEEKQEADKAEAVAQAAAGPDLQTQERQYFRQVLIYTFSLLVLWSLVEFVNAANPGLLVPTTFFITGAGGSAVLYLDASVSASLMMGSVASAMLGVALVALSRPQKHLAGGGGVIFATLLVCLLVPTAFFKEGGADLPWFVYAPVLASLLPLLLFSLFKMSEGKRFLVVALLTALLAGGGVGTAAYIATGPESQQQEPQETDKLPSDEPSNDDVNTDDQTDQIKDDQTKSGDKETQENEEVKVDKEKSDNERSDKEKVDQGDGEKQVDKKEGNVSDQVEIK